MTGSTPARGRDNRIAAALMLIAAGMAGLAATGRLPGLFVALGLACTAAALTFAIRGRSGAR